MECQCSLLGRSKRHSPCLCSIMLTATIVAHAAAHSPTVPADTMDEPVEGQLVGIPLLALLLILLLCPAVSILTCVRSEALWLTLLKCTNQCFATPVSSSVRPLSSSTESGTQAGVPTWVPTGTYLLGRVPSPGLQRERGRYTVCAAVYRG